MNMKRISQTALAGILGLCLLIGLNVLAAKQSWRWDTTANKRYSLAVETVHALRELDAPVTAVAFFRPEERAQIESLLQLFTQKTGEFTYEFVDPDRSPYRAKEYDVTQTGTVVLLSGNKTEKVLFPDEEKLINGVIRVSNPTRAKIYFVQGHGESNPKATGQQSCSMLAKALTDQGADVAPLTLARADQIPEDADTLVILGPKTDFLQHELDVLDAWWKKGGRLLIGLSAENKTNLDPWLANLGMKRLDGFTLDPLSRLIVGDPMAPIVQDYGYHPITRDFALMTVLPTATALAGAEGAPSHAAPLGSSTEQSWLETNLDNLREHGTAKFDEGEDTPGPLWLAAVYENTPGAKTEDGADGAPEAEQQSEADKAAPSQRAVVFADQDFATDQYVNMAGNLDIVRNSANWLMEREKLITVSKPKSANVFLTLSVAERMVVTWAPLFLLPLLCLGFAIWVAMSRRKVKQ